MKLSMFLFPQSLSSTLMGSQKFASCMNTCSASSRSGLFTTFLNVVSFNNGVGEMRILTVWSEMIDPVWSVCPENPSEPFGASVIIDGVTYGTGTASSKKLAKNKAGNVF